MTVVADSFLSIDEEERHEYAVHLSPSVVGDDQKLLELLADPSWRVRKAALHSVSKFTHCVYLVKPLVEALADPDNAGLRSAAAAALSIMGQVAVPGLIAALQSLHDADQRKFVVEVLGDIGGIEARDALLSALEGPDDNVRAAVADALGRLGGSGLLPTLVSRLHERREDVQLAAYILDALWHLGAVLSASELEPLLHKSSLLRLIYPLLGLSKDKQAVSILIEAIATCPRGARPIAIKALSTLYDGLSQVEQKGLVDELGQAEATITQLKNALTAQDDHVRHAAIHLLGLLNRPELAAFLLIAAADSAFAEKALVVVVTRLGKEALPSLLAAFPSAGLEAQILFVDAMLQLEDVSAVPLLLGLATGIEVRLAESALRALGHLGGIESIDTLVDLITQDDAELSCQAALSLSSIGRRHADEVAGKVCQAIERTGLQPAWLWVLGAIGRPSDLSFISSATHHDDPNVRRAAVEALGYFKNHTDENSLVLALTDENAHVRAAAARVLGAYRSERVRTALLVAAKDSNACVVVEALKSLGHVGGDQAITALRAALLMPLAPIAIAALDGLMKLQSGDALSALPLALRHSDPEVVCEAVHATMHLAEKDATSLLVTALTHASWQVRLAAADVLVRRNIAVPADLLEDLLECEEDALVKSALWRLQSLGRK